MIYASENAPHEALGRAARTLSRGGALYLGGGVGLEKVVGPNRGESFRLTRAGKVEKTVFPGPLSAVIAGFSAAGGSTSPDTPGGVISVPDAAVAARLRELADEISERRRSLAMTERRVAARKARSEQGWVPGAQDDDSWDQRRLTELSAEIAALEAERARLVAVGSVEESLSVELVELLEAGGSEVDTIMEAFGGALSEFDESLVRRDVFGRFAEKVHALKVGQSAALPDGVKVTRTTKGYDVHARPSKGYAAPTRPSGPVPRTNAYATARAKPKFLGSDAADPVSARSSFEMPATATGASRTRGMERLAGNAARAALDASAGSDHPKSLGGSEKHTSARATLPPSEVEVMASAIGGLTTGSGQQYPIVDGQGKAIGHARFTGSGYVVSGPGGSAQTFASARAAALAAHKLQRGLRQREVKRQGVRAANLNKMGVPPGKISEAFASAPVAAAQPGGLSAPRKPSAPGAASDDDDRKHPRGKKGTREGGRFVKKGASGEDVHAIQRKVGAKTDGEFGPDTEKAVREFQRRHGLTVDGIVGHQTAVALAGNASGAKDAKVGELKGSDVAKLRRMRRKRGRGERRGTAPERSGGGRVV